MPSKIGFRFGRSRRSGRKLLLDALGISPVGAYSTRRLTKNYNGAALRVRRSSDSAEQDIGFAGNSFDSASLLAFIGAGDGFVRIWYDQSGNGRNLVQATATNQPRIATGGAYLGGILTEAGTFQHVAATNSVFALHTTAATISSVLAATEVGNTALGTIWHLGSTSGARIWLGTDAGSRNIIIRGVVPHLPPTPAQTCNASGNVITFTKTASADMSGCQTRLNGSAGSTYAAQAIGTLPGNFGISQSGAATATSAHVHRELIAWNSTLSTGQIQLVERNQGAQFGIAVA